MPTVALPVIRPDSHRRIYWTIVSVDAFTVDAAAKPWTCRDAELWLAAVLEDWLNSCEKLPFPID
jgi:hypothetical protein